MAADGYPSLSTPAVHLKLDETTGDTATDASGNGNDGTLANFPGSPKWVAALHGNGLHFDGVDSFVNAFSPFGSAPTGVTISLKFKLDATFDSGASVDQDIISFNNAKTPDSQTDFILFRLESDDGKLHIANRRSSVDVSLTSTTVSWTGGVWYHVVYLADDTGGQLFVQNSSEDTDATIDMPEAMAFAAAGVTLYTESGRPFDGIMDEVLIWNDFKGDADTVQTLFDGPAVPSLGSPIFFQH